MAKQTIQIADKPTVDEILALLENAEVGLAALRLLLGNSADAATMNAVKSILENGTYGLNALDKDLGTITNYLANSTYGLAALKNAITGRANETTVNAVKVLLENGTYGLNALKTAVSNSNKFGSTAAGVLQLKGQPTITGTIDVNTKTAVAYTPEIKISGNGQIVIHECVCNNNRYNNVTYDVFRLENVMIDGNATHIAYRLNGGTDHTAVYKEGLKIEFGKSFQCRARLDSKITGASSITQANIQECDYSIYYYVQLR